MSACPALPTVRIVRDRATLAALRPAWQALWERAPGATAFQHPEYAGAILDTVPAPLDLAVLAAFEGAALVGLWPLHVARRGGLRRVRHLSNGSHEEYADPLIAAGAGEAVAAALAAAARGLGDVLELYNLDPGGPVWTVLAPALHGRRAVRWEMPCTSILLGGVAQWDQWLARKSRSFRQSLRYERKRLAIRGTLRFVVPETPEARAAMIGWCLASKHRWTEARGIRNSWLAAPHVAPLFERQVENGTAAVFGLAVDETLVAGCLCLRGTTALEFFLTTFDPDWSAYSPGQLMIEDLARWCLARGLDLDLRFPLYPYKARWSSDVVVRVGARLATTPRGMLALWSERAARVPQRARRGLAKVLRKARAVLVSAGSTSRR